MELDELKAAWKTLDQRLDAQAALHLHVYKEGKLDGMRRGLRPLAWGQAIQIVIGVLIAVWGASFWIEQRAVPHLLIAGLLVHAAGISMIAVGALIEARIASVDYSAPVLTIQRQLAQLRKVYVRGGLAIGLPWWLLWIPFLMVLFGYAGVDLYSHAPSVIWIGTAIGVVGLLATWAFVRLAVRWPQFAERLERSAAGGSINRAQARLDELARFERD